MSQYIIKLLMSNRSEGFQDIFAEMNKVRYVENRFEEAYFEEAEFSSYLFSKGSVIGLNEEIDQMYLRHLINRRLKAIGYKSIFEGVGKNPLPWIESYINMDKKEGMPQEEEVINYVRSGVDTKEKVDKDEFRGML
jgi:ribonucleoside-diphosphate reductase beta chain